MIYSLALVVFACMFYYTTSLHYFCTTFRLSSYINSQFSRLFNNSSKLRRKWEVQGPAEIPDDFAKQLRVEPLAQGICS
jgi:hypothetical protein